MGARGRSTRRPGSGQYVQMSIVIEPATVVAVLLGAEWYTIDEGSFVVDSYEYAGASAEVEDDGSLQLGGHRALSPSGFRFTVGAETYAGPLTAVMALRSKEKS
jgi:hypothetical protein